MSQGLIEGRKSTATLVENRDKKMLQWLSICGHQFRRDSLLSPVRL